MLTLVPVSVSVGYMYRTYRECSKSAMQSSDARQLLVMMMMFACLMSTTADEHGAPPGDRFCLI